MEVRFPFDRHHDSDQSTEYFGSHRHMLLRYKNVLFPDLNDVYRIDLQVQDNLGGYMS